MLRVGQSAEAGQRVHVDTSQQSLTRLNGAWPGLQYIEPFYSSTSRVFFPSITVIASSTAPVFYCLFRLRRPSTFLSTSLQFSLSYHHSISLSFGTISFSNLYIHRINRSKEPAFLTFTFNLFAYILRIFTIITLLRTDNF